MAFFKKCSACKRDSGVAFMWDIGAKVVACSFCGKIETVHNFPFIEQPEFLYKYRPHDSYSRSWITNEELFFASPAMFNDPFDSKVFYTVDGTRDQKKRYFSSAINDVYPGIKKRQQREMIKRALSNRMSDADYESHISRMQKRIDEYGIVSLSQKANDMLLFAYYGKDHTGYCLKYRRTAENVFSMARKVDYAQTYPKFSMFDEELQKRGALGDKVLYTKAKCWEHEQEWRIGFVNEKRVLKSPHDILVGIILGCNMRPSDRQAIIELNKGRTNPVAIYEARKKQFEFALEAIPLTIDH
jgi:hypothetical protein